MRAFPLVAVQCFCSPCLVFYKERVGKCGFCLRADKTKRHSKPCRLGAISPYWFRYNRDPIATGEFYKRLVHGASQQEAKLQMRGAKAAEKATKEAIASLEKRKKRQMAEEAPISCRKQLASDLQRAKLAATEQWVRDNPEVDLTGIGFGDHNAAVTGSEATSAPNIYLEPRMAKFFWSLWLLPVMAIFFDHMPYWPFFLTLWPCRPCLPVYHMFYFSLNILSEAVRPQVRFKYGSIWGHTLKYAYCIFSTKCW